jgi:hypothetical protein
LEQKFNYLEKKWVDATIYNSKIAFYGNFVPNKFHLCWIHRMSRRYRAATAPLLRRCRTAATAIHGTHTGSQRAPLIKVVVFVYVICKNSENATNPLKKKKKNKK